MILSSVWVGSRFERGCVLASTAAEQHEEEKALAKLYELKEEAKEG